MKRIDIGSSTPVEYFFGNGRTSGTRWRRFQLERHQTTADGEMPEGYVLLDTLVVFTKPPLWNEAVVPGDGRIATYKASATFYPASLPYAGSWRGGSEALLLQLRPDFLKALAFGESRALTWPTNFFTTNNRLVVELALAIEQDMLEGSPTGALYGESLCAALVSQLVHCSGRMRGRIGDSSSTPRTIATAIEFVHDNLADDLSIVTLAAIAGVSVDQFMRQFKLCTGFTPHQYVLRQRLARACKLLSDRHMSVAEVAQRAGFQDQSHFGKAFRRLMSVSPRVYREQMQK